MKQLRLLTTALVMALAIAAPAFGATCSSEPPSQTEYLQAIQLGFETTQYLEKTTKNKGIRWY
jgi:hypothetical protein